MCTMTHHARVERADRIEYILDTIGVGEVVGKYEKRNEYRYKAVTDTGVIMVTGFDNALITMYIGSMEEIIQTYRIATRRHEMPGGMYRNAKLAQKFRKNQP